MGQAKDIYIMGMCGTGTGSLAGMLQALGHRVRGSDQGVYPPMSEKLAEWGIALHSPFDAANLDPTPDIVVVGNVIRKDNLEAVAMRAADLPHMSMPQAVAEFGIGDKHALVVSGTHGKTTTSALAAHVAKACGLDPSFLVGGVLVGERDSFRVGQGDLFVVEGDEYDTAYFDKGPKFLHYRAQTAIITSLEFDHADIYASIEAIEDSFRRLIVGMAEDSHLVVWEGAERARRLLAEVGGGRRQTIYGVGSGADLQATDIEHGLFGLRFTPRFEGQTWARVELPLYGQHSLQNALAVWASLFMRGVDDESLASAMASFKGVRGRLEVLGEAQGVTVVDDFGHHPTAIATTLAGAREAFAPKRLWAVFEPRSATARRKVFANEFAAALSQADLAVVASHARLSEVPEADRFSPEWVAQEVSARGGQGWAIAEVPDIVAHIVNQAQAGDVVVVFSNGDFAGLPKKLLAALVESTPAG